MADVKGQAIVRRSLSGVLAAWRLLFAVAICCCAHAYRTLSAPVPIWTVFTTENSDLPDDHVSALAFGPDGTLWVGTIGGVARRDEDGHWQTYNKANTNDGLPSNDVRALAVAPGGALWVGTIDGLARRDKDGLWQTYTKANTNGGLPSNDVTALALGPDGALWVGTSYGGVGYFNRPRGQTIRIVDVISKVGEVTQAEQTVAVIAIDDSYLTQPEMFHYIWRMTELGFLGDRQEPEIRTKSSIYRTNFDHDGTYRLRVIAVDRYGNRSDPKNINFNVSLPKPESLLDRLASIWQIILAVAAALYVIALIILLLLTRRHAWAFRILSDAVWAKWLTWPFFSCAMSRQCNVG
jgi:ligand-binding sensor domain-containing protein